MMVAIYIKDLLSAANRRYELEYKQITRVDDTEATSFKGTTTYQSLTIEDVATERDGHSRRWLTQSRERSGNLFAFIAAACMVATGTLMYIVSGNLSLYQINAIVISVQLIGSALLMIMTRVPPSRNINHLLWVQPSGFLLAGANYFNVYACKYMATSDAMVITHVSLFLVGVLSFLVLKESFSVTDIFYAAIAFVGVVCVGRPTFIFDIDISGSPDTSIVFGTVLALGSAFCKAPYYVFIRKQGLVGVHPLQSSFANSITKVVVSLTLCIALEEWQSPTSKEWLCALGAGVFYLISHLALFMALSRQTAQAVSVILSIEAIISFMMQLVIFGLTPVLTCWIGALFVLAACIGTAIKEPISSDDGLVK